MSNRRATSTVHFLGNSAWSFQKVSVTSFLSFHFTSLHFTLGGCGGPQRLLFCAKQSFLFILSLCWLVPHQMMVSETYTNALLKHSLLGSSMSLSSDSFYLYSVSWGTYHLSCYSLWHLSFDLGTGKGGCPRGTDAGLSATWANLGYAHLCSTLQHCDFALALIFMLQLTAQSAPAAWLTRFIRALKDWLISLISGDVDAHEEADVVVTDEPGLLLLDNVWPLSLELLRELLSWPVLLPDEVSNWSH